LGIVWEYCVTHQIAFKFLTSKADFMVRNAKYANRSGSGKFITLYPAGTAEFEQTVADLSAALAGWQGPYILSDIRIGGGPVHVRYGGFAERFCLSETGEPVPAIEDPHGVLVPDPRIPAFRLPEWASVPEIIAPHLAALQSDDDSAAFLYTVSQALHFTNGGGIYEATDDRTGQHVVLREARPHAGLDSAGRDAMRRLQRENEVLHLLSDVPVVPRIFDYFTCWEHDFLAEEFIEGETLSKEMTTRAPLIHPSVSNQAVSEYTEWALDVLSRVEQAVDLIHDRGVVFGDLHPRNIILRPDGRICLVDFEAASLPGERSVTIMGAPGYVPPDHRTGVAVDDYAMACLKIALFMPLTALIALDLAKAEALIQAIAERFPVSLGFCQEIRTGLALNNDDGEKASVTVPGISPYFSGDEQDDMASMMEAIDASATPERLDRLFPGDIRQFTDGALGLACGASGVLYARAIAGFGTAPEHEKWLTEAVHQTKRASAGGFYNGLHGVAYALDKLGHRDAALNLLADLMEQSLDDLPLSLYAGLAGIGLNLLYFAGRTGDSGLRDAALNVADRLSSLIAALPRNPDTADPAARAGLMHGASGRALFFIRLFESTRDEAFLDLALGELNHDLDLCVRHADGTLQVDDGRRLLPYIEGGSAGIALVLDEYLGIRNNDRFEQAIEPIVRAAEPEFIICTGLFNGRAGLMAMLSHLRDSGRMDRAYLQPIIELHRRRLAWHVVSYQGKAAFPGDQLVRMSMDLATGSAGILLSLHAVRNTGIPLLPLVSRPASSPDNREPAGPYDN
jgi:hypothetical protein